MIDLRTGDCLEVLRTLPSDHFDAALSDPPYGEKFPGLSWDKVLPPHDVWRELARVMKPGSNALIFGGRKTVHRLHCDLEDAGFSVEDTLLWLYGDGQVKAVAARSRLKPMYEPILHVRAPGGLAPLNIEACRTPEGRWPANVMLDEEAVGALDAHAGVTSTTGRRSERSRNAIVKGTKWSTSNHKSVEYLDTGYASRFFYCPKVKGKERKHPTQKPDAVTSWLGDILFIPSRPRARLLVPYAGVGSEIVGAQRAGWAEIVGIEQSPEYVHEAMARVTQEHETVDEAQVRSRD